MRSHPSYRTKVATSVCVPWCQGGAKRRKIRKLVRYYYLVPTVANPWFSFSYPDVFLTGFVKRKTPQSLEITAFLERVDEKDAPYMSVAVYMLYGCFTLQRKPWRSGDLFASSISNEQQAPN